MVSFRLAPTGKTAVADAKLVTPKGNYPMSVPRPTFRFVWHLPDIAPSFVEAMEAAIYLVMVEFAVDMLDDLNVKQNLT